MSDDETPDGTEEPTVDPTDDDARDPHDADAPGDDDADGDDETDVAELRTRLEEAEAEAARYKRRLVASDLRKKQVERELREARGASKPRQEPDDDKQSTPDDRDAEIERLRTEVAKQRLRAQFDAVTKHQWQDPDAAYRLLDLDEVRQDDGTVDRDDLADAVDALAKKRPFLLKTPDTPKRGGERPTGQQPGSHRREQKTDRTAAYPVLRGRV